MRMYGRGGEVSGEQMAEKKSEKERMKMEKWEHATSSLKADVKHANISTECNSREVRMQQVSESQTAPTTGCFSTTVFGGFC